MQNLSNPWSLLQMNPHVRKGFVTCTLYCSIGCALPLINRAQLNSAFLSPYGLCLWSHRDDPAKDKGQVMLSTTKEWQRRQMKPRFRRLLFLQNPTLGTCHSLYTAPALGLAQVFKACMVHQIRDVIWLGKKEYLLHSPAAISLIASEKYVQNIICAISAVNLCSHPESEVMVQYSCQSPQVETWT